MKTSSQFISVAFVDYDLEISHSATTAIAYLMRKQHKVRDDVLAEVHAKPRRTKPIQLPILLGKIDPSLEAG